MDSDFHLTIKAVPGWSTPPDVRLRRLLKSLLRGFGFRVVTISECGQQTGETVPTHGECFGEAATQSES